jgi:hypothetical protein
MIEIGTHYGLKVLEEGPSQLIITPCEKGPYVNSAHFFNNNLRSVVIRLCSEHILRRGFCLWWREEDYLTDQLEK